ncbi:hypothetical protein [Paenibacillus sp. P22]|uniref:hypothetical protein n=1 Tax=Paenibacillus sp. P22 TaxID=483908 RepID=UPI0004356FAF|nr:hypothetical protein [Paenibacillus sp. P22]CDN43625.1 hypothetical protein BN871_DF_00520 [Paenibacillus sp. P22]
MSWPPVGASTGFSMAWAGLSDSIGTVTNGWSFAIACRPAPDSGTAGGEADTVPPSSRLAATRLYASF